VVAEEEVEDPVLGAPDDIVLVEGVLVGADAFDEDEEEESVLSDLEVEDTDEDLTEAEEVTEAEDADEVDEAAEAEVVAAAPDPVEVKTAV